MQENELSLEWTCRGLSFELTSHRPLGFVWKIRPWNFFGVKRVKSQQAVLPHIGRPWCAAHPSPHSIGINGMFNSECWSSCTSCEWKIDPHRPEYLHSSSEFFRRELAHFVSFSFPFCPCEKCRGPPFWPQARKICSRLESGGLGLTWRLLVIDYCKAFLGGHRILFQ